MQEYYDTLDSLNTPTRVSGRVTAELELAGPSVFHSETVTPFGREGFSKKTAAAGYEIIADTKDTLLWEVPEGERPLLILTSQQVSQEYLAYLDAQNISWIACGETKIDLPRACEILAEQFGVERMAVVGSGHINAGFLAADLLDEVSVLIGAGIDGRGGMPAVFDGLPMERPVTELNDDVLIGQVWSREEQLSLRDRSLVTVVALMAQGLTDESFRYHLISAKKNGITKEEMAEIITHAAFYCGWPKAWAVFRMAKEVYGEE